ncbi:hypothetical protein N826_23930 [Skermanella aerolata KACC 11604]|nr:hypothetical protein N826_23930 [Skermanella aerolata KACC 11604]
MPENVQGLSPQARGSLGLDQRVEFAVGSIPAGAGEPGLPAKSTSRSGVYPCRRGGAHRDQSLASPVGGLSPQARGSPCVISASASRYRVYPRRRTEAHGAAHPNKPKEGLSPQARGSLAQSREREFRTGSIPACAGEPPSTATGVPFTRVYPRRRGEAVCIHTL